MRALDLVLIAALLGCSRMAPAPADQGAGGGAELVMDHPGDLGVHPLGSVARESVTLRNVSGEELHLTEVAKSCGCTSAELADDRVPAGGRVALSLEVRVDTPRPRQIHLQVLGGREPGDRDLLATLPFSFSPDLTERLEVVPRVVQATLGADEERRPTTLRIACFHEGRDLVAERLRVELPEWAALLALREDPAAERVLGQQWFLATVEVHPPAGPGRFAGRVRVTTDERPVAAGIARLEVRREGGVQAERQLVFLGTSVASGQRWEVPLTVAEGVEIGEVECDLSYMEASVTAAEATPKLAIAVRAAPTVPGGLIEGRVTIPYAGATEGSLGIVLRGRADDDS